MKYKHIVFDIDGTLIDTEYAVINSLIKTITEITGRAPQYESLKFALGITGRNALELLKILDIEDALKRWDKNMKLLPRHTIQPFQGYQRMLAIPFIKRLYFRHCNLQNISRILF